MNCFEYGNPAFKIKILDYTYSSEPSINTALPLKQSKIKIFFYVLGIVLSFGFIWLLSKWSAKRKAIFTTVICSLEEATEFLISDQDSEGETTLVKRLNKIQVRIKRTCPSFNYHERNYIYIEEKQVFVPVRYQQLGQHLDKLKKDKFQPITQAKRVQLLDYYGLNVISLKVLNLVQIFIQEMLTPFEVFQTYGIILWIYEQYYLFSGILMSYSVYTYWKNAKKIKQNQEKLAFQSYYDVQTKVLVNESEASSQGDQVRQQVQLCKNELKIDEHKSEIIKDHFRGIEDIDKDLQMTVKRTQRRQSKQVKNEENMLINNKNVRFQTISSHKLVPGDIILLNELDVVPCDCILLRGEALVDESFSTGENYLVRKQQIQNFTYVKQDQKSFNLYLGTIIRKIKNSQFKLKKKNSQGEMQILSSRKNQEYGQVNELVCLVTNTNFNTLRGKFLRAIRYQAKQESNFFKQTIYFIYILIVITTIFYFGYLKVIGPYTSAFSMFITYIDLIFVAIPPTLPTILMLGIEFVIIRLQNHGINCVFPKSSLIGGKVNTIILKGQQVFGKDYEIQSASIGTKGQRGFGLTFSTVNQFESYADDPNISHRNLQELQLKKKQRSQFHKIGTFFINALSSCHTLQFFQHEIQGSILQKKIFEFSQARNVSQDQFQTLNYRISIHKIVRFKQQSMMLAVIATMKQKNELLQSGRQGQMFDEFDGINENSITKKNKYMTDEQSMQKPQKQNKNKNQKSKKVIFLKGSAEKVLQNCSKHTYPADAFEYIVDMAEKGFILFCYAIKQVDLQFKQQFDYQEYVNKSEFTFLGFVILEQLKSQQNLEAIKSLDENDVKIIYVSQQRELQATSKAVSNGICDKNELILCNISKNKDKVYCKGHIEWQSSTSQPISQFLSEFQEFGKNSKISLSSPFYTQLYMKKEIYVTDNIFDKTLIYNKMDLKCQKNLYTQLQRRERVSCAVGCSADLSQSSILSIELQREKSALLSNFYSKSNSLKTVVNCLRICRAGLSTNFHGFSMMILFTLTQFTSVIILNYNYEQLNNDQMLFDDLFVTFPIFITINLTQPASKLSKQLPPNSFFCLRNMVSMGGQLLIQFLAQLSFALFVFSMEHFKNERQNNFQFYSLNSDFKDGSVIAQGIFILTNYLYLGIVLSTSVSKPFRKPFYTNPFYTLNMILVWCLNTLLVVFSSLSFSQLRSQDNSQDAQFVRVLALVVGNLVMLVMYLYENLLFFIWKNKGNCLKRAQAQEIVIMKEGRQVLN